MTFAEYELKQFGYVVITDYFDQLENLRTRKEIFEKYKELFEDAKKDYKKLTELVIVLNTLCWKYHNSCNHKISQLYAGLYHKTHDFACRTLKGEEFEYYYNITN